MRENYGHPVALSAGKSMEPTRENSEIGRGLDVLEKQLIELRESIGTLCGRVDPVCKPPSPAVASSAGLPPMSNPSPVANMIGNLCGRAREMRALVDETAERVDL